MGLVRDKGIDKGYVLALELRRHDVNRTEGIDAR